MMINEKKAKLDNVKRKTERAINSGLVVASEQLRNAQRQAEAHLLIAQQRLQKLIATEDATWTELKLGLDIACDDLSESLKKLVARVY